MDSFLQPLPGWRSTKRKSAAGAQDCEKLNEELRKMKQSVNTIREENLRLKTRIQHCDQEADKKDKVINGLLQQVQQLGSGGPAAAKKQYSGTHLVLALKKQVKEIKAESAAKDEELRKLKKCLKVTISQEMEVEIKMYADECTRLKHIIEQVVRQKSAGGPELQQQNSLISELRQECDALALALQKQEEENDALKDQIGKKAVPAAFPVKVPGAEQKRADELAKQLAEQGSKLEGATREVERLRKELADCMLFFGVTMRGRQEEAG